MLNELITIITPIHTLEFLQNCIDNFERQSFANKELLLIANGELQTYNNNKYNIVNSNSKNIAQLRNIGLEWMNSNNRKIFAFFDSDDFYDSEYLNEALLKLNEGYDIVGKLNYKFKIDNDLYQVSGLKDKRSIHGPTMFGYLSDLRFDEQYHSMAEDVDFISKHKNIGITSSNNWIYNVRNNSIQNRSSKSFIEQIKHYATACNDKDLIVTKNQEHYWKLGDHFDPWDLFYAIKNPN